MTNQDFALYNIRRGPHGYTIAKFDRDLTLLAAYNTAPDYCDCPAGPRPTCRHRKMLPRMLSRVDTDAFYCYETNTWSHPLIGSSDPVASEASSSQEPEPPIEPMPIPQPKPASVGIRRR